MPEWTLPSLPIRTERLLLRHFDPDTDVDAVHAYASLPEVCRYIPWEPRTRDEVADRLAEPERQRTAITPDERWINLAVTLRDDDAPIGDLMLMLDSFENSCLEIGYVLNPACGGHGYATEACRELLRIGFEDFGVHRVVARTDARNERSGALLRRIGMRQEAVLIESEWFKEQWSDEVDFALLAREWPPSGG